MRKKIDGNPEDGETVKISNRKKRSRRERTGIALLFFLGVALSAGSMAWAIFSVEDMMRGERVPEGSSLGLALTMDAMWAATMIVQTLGKWLPVTVRGRTVDLISVLGWAQLALVMSILAWHGSEMGNVMAVFGAVLPLSAKVTWMLFLSITKDPTEPDPESRENIQATQRNARITLEKMEAEAELKEARLAAARKEHEARMEQLRAEEEERREAARLRAETERLEIENEARLKLEREKAEAELKLETERMGARLQIEVLRARQEVDLELIDAQREALLRSPVVSGQVLRGGSLNVGSPMQELSASTGDGSAALSDADRRKEEARQKRMAMAQAYYMKAAERGGNLTKTAFAKANDIHLSRLSEATTEFPESWFVENDLAPWRNGGQQTELIGSAE